MSKVTTHETDTYTDAGVIDIYVSFDGDSVKLWRDAAKTQSITSTAELFDKLTQGEAEVNIRAHDCEYKGVTRRVSLYCNTVQVHEEGRGHVSYTKPSQWLYMRRPDGASYSQYSLYPVKGRDVAVAFMVEVDVDGVVHDTDPLAIIRKT